MTPPASITTLPQELLTKITLPLPAPTTAFLRATCRTLYLLIPAPRIANLDRLYILRTHAEEAEAAKQRRWAELVRLRLGRDEGVGAGSGGEGSTGGSDGDDGDEAEGALCGGCRAQHPRASFSPAQLRSGMSARERRCTGRERAVRIAAGLKLYFSGAERLVEVLRRQRTMSRWVHVIAFGAGEGGRGRVGGGAGGGGYDGRYWVWEQSGIEGGAEEEDEKMEKEVKYPADATNPVFTLAEAKGELCIDNMITRSFTATPKTECKEGSGLCSWDLALRKGSPDCLLCPHTSVLALVSRVLSSSASRSIMVDTSTTTIHSSGNPLQQSGHECNSSKHTHSPHDKRFYRPWMSSDSSSSKASGKDDSEREQRVQPLEAIQQSTSTNSAASGPVFPFCKGPHVKLDCEDKTCETIFYIDWLFKKVRGGGYGYNTARIYWTRSLGNVSGDAMDARWIAQLQR